jgi:hypothetical protein
MPIDILSELQFILEDYVEQCEEARTWGGPTMYPRHPITEHSAKYYSRKLKELINDLQDPLSSRQ